jgi:hypothetical protein
MTKDLGVWTAEDCALVPIDYQNESFEVIRSETPRQRQLDLAGLIESNATRGELEDEQWGRAMRDRTLLGR